jgi:hypothetical protein
MGRPPDVLQSCAAGIASNDDEPVFALQVDKGTAVLESIL